MEKDESSNNKVPFSPGDWIIDKNNPSQPGQYTGNWRMAGPHIMVQMAFPGGSPVYRPLSCLEAMQKVAETIEDRLMAGHFGRMRDLQRLITYEKLKGVLHEHNSVFYRHFCPHHARDWAVDIFCFQERT